MQPPSSCLASESVAAQRMRLLSLLDDRSTMQLMPRPDTRKVLIDEGLKALLANGYDGVGIGPVLAAAGVPKGSFYHFFRSKEEFACAVLDAYAERYLRL